MKICKKCTNEFEPQKGLLNYCTIECRNSRVWNDADKLKRSETLKKAFAELNPEKVLKKALAEILKDKNKKEKAKIIALKKYERDKLKEENGSKTLKEIFRDIWDKKIMDKPFEELKWDSLRRRIILEQKMKCNNCKLHEWLGQELPLEIDHIDGNNLNNERLNLEALCPNCHSITPTWRGRNISKRKTNKKISPDDFVEAFLEEGNIRKALLKLGLAAKGGNYPKMYKCLELAGIDASNFVIKKNEYLKHKNKQNE